MITTPSRRDEAETVISIVEVLIPHECVMSWRMMLVKITRFVGFSWAPVNEEGSLAFSTFEPI